MNFGVEIYDLNGIQLAPDVSMTPVRFSARSRGGPEKAEIQLDGPLAQLDQARRWLDYRVVIVDSYGVPRWWGRIYSATVNRGGVEKGRSVEGMYNRVKVRFSALGADGAPVSTETAWVEDGASVAAYGAIELIYSGGDQTETGALALANQILSRVKRPVVTTTPAIGQVGGMLHCRGVWGTLDRAYYANDKGRLVFSGGGVAQLLGWGIEADGDLCFADGALQDVEARLGALSDGDQLRVSGSTSNNGAKTCDGAATGEKKISYTAATIRFETTDDIKDTAKGFSFVRPGAVVKVSGSTSNDGYHLAETNEDRGYFTTETTFGGQVVAEPSGASVTITQGQSVRLEGGVTNETPGTISVYAYGQTIAYSFSPTGTGGWTVAEIIIRIHRVGSPTDSVVVSLHSDNGGSVGTQLDSATVSGASLYTADRETTFDLSNTVTVTPGTTYWIQIDRTGAADPSNYYVVTLDEEDGGGTLKLHDGAAWQARTPAAHLVYEVWGHMETSAQIEAILAAAPGRTAGVSVRVDSGIEMRQYRDGTLNALDELEALLDTGMSTGNRLSALVDADEMLIIDAELDDDLPTLQIEVDGQLTRYGQPLRPGELPVGEWAVDGDDDDVTMAGGGAVFVDWAEYDASSGWLSWRERDALDVWDFGRIVQG